MHETFWTMLRHLSGEPAEQLILMVVWKGCQWSSEDGTDDELREMYKHHGLDCEIRVCKR